MKLNPVKQRVWKAVWAQGGLLYSSAAEVRGSAYGLNYIPNVVAKPKIGKIFCFESLSTARLNFGSHIYRSLAYEIWEAEGYGAVKPEIDMVFDPIYLHANRNEIALELWGKIPATSSWKFDANKIYLMKGTLFCKSIKLLRKVA
jgi:hypothetical protein